MVWMEEGRSFTHSLFQLKKKKYILEAIACIHLCNMLFLKAFQKALTEAKYYQT